MMFRKKITVLGASGELGFKLVEKLHQNGFHINCIVRNNLKKDFSSFKNITIKEVSDICKTHELASAFKDSEVIINTSYIWFAPEIKQALDLLKHKPKHIIFTGSTGIYTKLESKSAQDKIIAESFIVDNYIIPWTIIRPTMIYGHPNDRNISKLARAIQKFPAIPLIGSGDSLIQPVHIDDLIKSFEKAILNEKMFFKFFNIGGKEPVSNKTLFKIVAKHLNRKIMFIRVNPKLISILIKTLGILGLKPVSQEQVLRFQENKNIDLKPFIETFGFEPISFDKGFEKYVSTLDI